MDLFNEFTVKIKDLREEIYDNLNGLDVIFEEDVEYVESCINLMNASDFE